MSIGKIKTASCTTARVKDPLNLLFFGGGRAKNSGSEQLKILRNNLPQQFKLG